jgi:hypothetical protein
MDLLRYYAPLVGEDLTAAVERMAAKLEKTGPVAL